MAQVFFGYFYFSALELGREWVTHCGTRHFLAGDELAPSPCVRKKTKKNEDKKSDDWAGTGFFFTLPSFLQPGSDRAPFTESLFSALISFFVSRLFLQHALFV